MPREEKLKLGKGPAFVKGRLKRLRQEDETWEADFRALPKPMMQNETHYLGLVVKNRGGSVLATADQHADQLAVYGIELALKLLKKEGSPADTTTPVDLITAESLGSK